MQIAALSHADPTANLGDDIQTLAVERFLPRVDRYVDRDRLDEVESNEDLLLVLHGWITPRPAHWPPADCIEPLVFSFHIGMHRAIHERLLSPDSIAWFKRHEPIGCRDRTTQRLLNEHGVATTYTRCVTLTLPRRETEPANGQVFLVDMEGIPVPDEIARDAIRVTHQVPQVFSHTTRQRMAQELLDTYRDRARLVVTTRLHCALPCAAMGIPVVFFGNPEEYRVQVVTDLAIPIHAKPSFPRRELLRFLDRVVLGHRRRLRPVRGLLLRLRRVLLRHSIDPAIDWNPPARDITAIREATAAALRSALARHLG